MLVREAREAAAGARRQIIECAAAFAELAHRPAGLIVTCARGSSDHAALYGKYVLETHGRIVASIGPSVASLYRAAPPLDHLRAIVIVVSQSGHSPDLLAVADTARAAGALVVAFVNDETSPLAAAADIVVPLCAGEERAVVATKSWLLSGLAFLQLAAACTGDPALHDAIARLPDALDAACELDWSTTLAPLAHTRDLYVVGRGVGLGAAGELALKLKETCRLHAEAFSTAEVLHGPVALIEPGFPVIALGQPDATADTTRATISRLVELGAATWSTLPVAGAATLPTVDVPAVIAPLCQLQSAYLALPALAAARGLDADAPAHLHKVTRTL